MSSPSMLGIWKTFEGGITTVEHRCVAVRNRHASCRRCAQACPTGAITVEDGSLAVAPELCDGCGLCAQACPTEALLPGGTDISPAVRERELHVQADGTLPHFVPERRRKLLELAQERGRADGIDMHDEHWGAVSIDVERCESCRMCAVFCPTGAIDRYDAEDGSFGLTHDPSLCVKCGSCADVCYSGALTLAACDDMDALVHPRAERIELKPMRYQRGGAHSAVNAMRYRLGLTSIYER